MKERKRGSVSVPHFKNTSLKKCEYMETPDTVVVPMLQHIGAVCTPVVKDGDVVKKGQLIGDSDAFISAPIHSSIGGTVKIAGITLPGGQVVPSVVITASEDQSYADTVKPVSVNTHKDFVRTVRDGGIVGLGGAGFPTHVKLSPKNPETIDTLIVNGAECEPYITADELTMVERGADILDGVRLVMKYLNLKNAVIAIEDNKPEAIRRMNELLENEPNIRVKKLISRYPQGAEKVLIFETVKRVVPEGKLPSDVGVVVLNVETAVSISDYIKTGIPLITRCVTVDGDVISQPKNIIVPVGALISDIADACGGYSGDVRKILIGGPMMGTAVWSDKYPIVKNNNALLFFGAELAATPNPTPCIRCGKCVRACPMKLIPTSLERCYETKDSEGLIQLNVNLCIECGCCSYICPAKRNLVQSIKLGKLESRSSK